MRPRRRDLIRDEGGGIAVLAAGVLAMTVAIVGLVVDLGGVHDAQRRLQAATDAAAMAAARAPDRGQEVARRALRAHGFADENLDAATPGGYAFAPGTAPDARFTPGGGGAAEAVRVAAHAAAPLHFYRLAGTDHIAIAATATAVHAKEAAFSAGTGLAAIDNGLLDSLLTALTGQHVDLSLLDYQSLVHTNINVLQFLEALDGNLGLDSATYDELLAAGVRLGQVLDAMLDVTTDTAARAALEKLRQQLGMGERLQLGDLLDLGLWSGLPLDGGGRRAALHAEVSLFDLISLAAQVADGERLLDLSLPVVVPGVTSVNLKLALGGNGEPRIAVGPEGTRVHTEQARLLLDLRLVDLNVLGLLHVGVRLPLYLEAAAGDAWIQQISCGIDPAEDGRVVMLARSGPVALAVGEVDNGAMQDFDATVAPAQATIVDVTLLRVKASAAATAAGNETPLTFTQEDIRNQTVRRVPGSRSLSSLLGGLASTLNITVPVLGLPLVPVGLIVGLVRPLLVPVLGAIEPVIDGVLRGLGIQLGYIDVSVRGMRCGVVALVN